MKQEYRHTKPIRGKHPRCPSCDCEEDLDSSLDDSYNTWSDEIGIIKKDIERDEKDNKDKVPD
jgi:hypothetical protein